MANVRRSADTQRLTKCPTAAGGLTRVAYARAMQAGIEASVGGTPRLMVISPAVIF
jgi:hypothetical protein